MRKLSDDLREAVLDPTTRTKLETTGNYPNPMSPSELLAYIQAEQIDDHGSLAWEAAGPGIRGTAIWTIVLEEIARNP